MNKLPGKEKSIQPHIIDWIDNLQASIWSNIVNCLTGMRPSGRLHLWHYKGALENWLKLQDVPNVRNNFLIADYQVLGDHLGETERLRESVIDMVIDWLALWLDPDKSNFIIQSYVPEFAELFNYLTMFTPFSVATNNPTLKDEQKKIKERENENSNSVSLWFMNYPVSQVADIMLLGWTIIPVGGDQVPHIELARKIIKKVNTMYWTSFPLPLALLSEVPRLVWTDGGDKMSKSLWNTIYLTASPKEIKTQVNKMYTDPGKTGIEAKGDISNHVVFKYLDIFCSDKELIQTLKDRYIAWWVNSVGDGELKKILVEILEKLISPIRARREYYKNRPDLVISAIESGSSRAKEEWQKILKELKEAMGLLNYGK